MAAVFGVALAGACSGAEPEPTADGGAPDAGRDAGGTRDAGHDAGGVGDAGNDAGGSQDSGHDAGADAGSCGACSGLCLADGGCVECEPGPGDSCPALKRCNALTFTCEQGCKANAECASGTCVSSGDCDRCQGDSECSEGRLCGTGSCSAPCANTGECTSGATCCQGRCVDTARDINHCGACGTACGANGFCSGNDCQALEVKNVCATMRITTLLDGLATDDDAGVALSNALVATCSPPPTAAFEHQADAGVIDPRTGRPLVAGGELLLAAGGSFLQKHVAYLEQAGLAPLYPSGSGTHVMLNLRDGGVPLSVLESTLTASHDYFVIELVRAPGGSLSLVVYGLYAPGTTAAAWYFANRLLPERETFGGTGYVKSWYVLEWTDTNADLSADENDTWTVIASGP